MAALKRLALMTVLAAGSWFAVPASAAPTTTPSEVIVRVSGPAMAARQDPVQDERAYARREAQSRTLEEFTGGAVGIIAAVLIVLLILLLI